MKIDSWTLESVANGTEVSACVDGFRLWFRVPAGLAVSRLGDPFLSVAIMPAMLRGGTLEIDPGLPVSTGLLKNILMIEDIFHCWNRELKFVPVSASLVAAERIKAGRASFFSGGVDSTYTFLERAGDIDRAVFIQGFDFYAGRSGFPELAIDDIADLSQLAYRLAFSSDKLSCRIRAGFTDESLQAMEDYDPRTSDPAALEGILLRELNAVISGPPLENKLGGDDPKTLNRRLLEAAYKVELAGAGSGIYGQAVERNRRFTASLGKDLVPVETNAFPFGYRYNLSRNMSHGSVLGAVAQLLGFERAYIPGSASYDEMVPLGSHPLSDPLWSNGAVEVIHDGADMKRIEKLELIAGRRPALENLRVCFNDMNVNCGVCGKCLRTMIGLALMDIHDGPFPPLPPLRSLDRDLFKGALERLFLKQTREYALSRGKKKMAAELAAILARNDRRLAIKEMDKAFLKGRLSSLRIKLEEGRPGFRRITLDALNG